jgi:uncharacterized membrane protein YdbT with pleckstrin-like domain
MRYVLRPAWRSQWGLMMLAIVLLVIPFLPFAETIDFDNLTASFQNAVSALDVGLLSVLGVPFVLVLLIMVYRHHSWLFTVGDGNVESRHGIIAREVRSIRIADVRNINVKQSLFDRLLFIGDIEIGSAGTADIEVVFHRVGRPFAVKRKIQNLQ